MFNFEKIGKQLAVIDGVKLDKKIVSISSINDEDQPVKSYTEVPLKDGKYQQVPNPNTEREILYRVGPSGSGKSYYTRAYIQEYKKKHKKADIFLFPSFREPSGSVIFEALRHGLCVVTADRGGPGHVIDETCGKKADPVTPEIYAAELAAHVRALASDPDQLAALSKGARFKAESIGLWPGKLQRLMAIYENILTNDKRAAA